MSDLIEIHESAWVAPSAEIYGRVTIGPESSVWPRCVIRAEDHEVRVGRCTNLQDLVMVHIGYANETIIGDYVSVTHHATVHGCVVEDDCLIGINAVIMDGAVVGQGSIVAPGAVVTEGAKIAPFSIVAGIPAKVISERDSTDANRENALLYRANADAYRRGDHRVWDGMDTGAYVAPELERIRRERAT
jgi:carbonic anhydrase/acetyltransferase-like protein (isoleucine patch superfamily)